MLFLTLLCAAFAGNPVFNVLDFGAKGDGKTNDTLALRKALEQASAHDGPSTVHLPKDHTFLTAPINISSETTLLVDGTLLGITDQRSWPIIAPLPSYGTTRDDHGGPLRYQALVMAGRGADFDCHDITITGDGIIDGNGPFWWTLHGNKHPNETLHAGRGHLIETLYCNNVEISKLTLKDSPFWTLHPTYSKDVWIHHLNITSPLYAQNVDGVDPDSCQNVIVEYNTITCGDDHVVIKSGMDKAGVEFGMPSQNITVRYNTLGRGMGLSIGSETSGGIKDIHFHDNVQTGEGWNVAMHIKSGPSRGGVIENVLYERNRASNTTIAMNIGLNYAKKIKGQTWPFLHVRNITFRGNTVDLVNLGGGFYCNPNATCDEVTVEDNVVLNLPGKHWGASNIVSWKASNNTDEDSLEEALANAKPGVFDAEGEDIPLPCTFVRGVDREKCLDYFKY